MTPLEQIITLYQPDAIRDALADQNISVVIDWREHDEEIVLLFSDRVDGTLTCDWTTQNDLRLQYGTKTADVGLQENPADRDRTLRAVRDILQPDYEIRALRGSLDGDTFEFVIAQPGIWRDLEATHGELVRLLFVPFTDDVKFGD